MRVVLLADRSFAEREHAMLRRLEIGLVDEGTKVIRAVPRGCSTGGTTGVVAELTYPDDPWRLGALSPARALTREVLAVSGPVRGNDPGPIDIVHAWGHRVWNLALELAWSLGCVAMLEVWSAAALARVHAIEKRWTPRLESEGGRGVWIAPDAAMNDALGRLPRAWTHALCPWGVYAPQDVCPGAKDQCTAFAILASAADPSLTASMLVGLAAALKERDDVLAFIDAPALERHAALGKRLAELGLRSRVSVIPDMERRRDPVLRADALICPDRAGEQRTLMLEAMAVGMTLICRSDPLVEATAQRQGALVIDSGTAAEWERALRVVIEEPQRARQVGLQGRTYVQKSRLAHAHVQATLHAYAQALQAPIPLNAS